MTTGSWLVLFSVPDCPSCESLKPVLEELGTDEEVYESGIVLGSVDCSENQAVCLRFSTTKLPVLLYLHKKQLYKFPRDEEFGTPPTLESLKSFVLSPSASLAQAIPDPPSALDTFFETHPVGRREESPGRVCHTGNDGADGIHHFGFGGDTGQGRKQQRVCREKDQKDEILQEKQIKKEIFRWSLTSRRFGTNAIDCNLGTHISASALALVQKTSPNFFLLSSIVDRI